MGTQEIENEATTPASEPDVAGAGGLAAEIVTTGTEILLGEIVDTNAAWIAQQLRDIGVNLYYKTTVGDNFGRISQVIAQAMARSHVVIVSGGLGPTVDDVTRHAIAAATACELKAHPDALAALKARFERLGVQMTENNLQQALIPDGATIIENPVGTAPGFIVETTRDGHTSAVIALPGVPREMKHLMAETVLPYLRKRAGNVGVISRRVLRTIGIGESMIDARLSELMHGNNPTVGLAAHTAQADVRITARGNTAEQAESMLDGLENEIRRRIGDHIYSTEPGQSIEEVVAMELGKRGAGLAVVEAQTRGAIVARLSAVAGGTVVRQGWSDAHATDQGETAGENGAGEGLQTAPPEVSQLLLQQGGAGPNKSEQVAAAARAGAQAAGAAIGLAVYSSPHGDNGVFGNEQGETVVAVYCEPGLSLSAGDVARTILLPYAAGDEYSLIRIGNQVLGLLWNLLK